MKHDSKAAEPNTVKHLVSTSTGQQYLVSKLDTGKTMSL